MKVPATYNRYLHLQVVESYTIGRENFGMEKEFIAEIVQNCPNAACKFYKAQLDMSHSHNKPTYIPEVQSPSKFVIIAYFFESGKVHSQSVHICAFVLSPNLNWRAFILPEPNLILKSNSPKSESIPE